MKFIEINKKLKEKIENVYNIIGDDVYLIKQTIANIKSYLIKDMEEFNFVKVDADKLNINSLEVLLATLPIMNDYRLIVLNLPNAEIVKFLNKYKYDEQVVVVCINAEKLTIGEKIDCSKLDKSDISKYILSYLSKSKLGIQEQALDYLIDATNGNMSNVVNELGKITAYAKDEEVVTLDMVLNLVTNTADYAIFMLTNAIDNKNLHDYQKILNDMSKSLSLSEIYAYMGKYCKRMQYLCLYKNDEELAKILNIKPYAIKMSRQAIAKNGIKFYLDLYQKYIDLDYKVKSGKISVKNALYELVF